MSNMRKIPVTDLKPGMIFSKAVYVDKNNMLIPANVELKESDLKKLATWGVAEIETAGELVSADDNGLDGKNEADISGFSKYERKIIHDYNELLKKRKRLIEIYQKARLALEEIYNSIRNDSPFEDGKLKKSVDEIIQIANENSNIFLFLYGLEEGKDIFVSHAIKATFYAINIGIGMKYPMNSLRELGLGTLLLNSGMLKVPLYITRKQSNLTDQEYNQVKTHTLHGYSALKKLGNISEKAAIITLQHHEQFDGKGYPRGLKNTEIDEYARIVAIADSYESQISNRSYRAKMYFYNAMRNLLSGGVSKYDPEILKIFLSKMSVYPIGSIVEINDSRIGIVIGSIPEKPLRPILKMIFDKDKNRIQDTIILNLLDDTSSYIVKALGEDEVGINIFDVL